ncbi:MAG TPA: histidine kinase dimerization/phospho-acceptor domain-containing protein [Chloroflexia bacterium]|nr:histidine kinase dimerization/phospho-acceptor domain-containing protein [Chloroflexia bacterium]
MSKKSEDTKSLKTSEDKKLEGEVAIDHELSALLNLRYLMHEIQQPLTVIMIVSEMAQNQAPGPEMLNDFGLIFSESKKIHQILTSMRQLTTTGLNNFQGL